MMRQIAWFFFFIVLLGAGGCSRKPPTFLEPPFENREHGRFPGDGVELREPYRLGVGDEISIEVYRYPEFNGEVKIDPTGVFRFPYTREKVQALDLSLEELEAVLAGIVSEYVKTKPEVLVNLKKCNSRYFYVMGAVARPNRYAMDNEYVFVREALGRAGWPLKNSAMHRAWLVSSKPDRNAKRKIDLHKIIYTGDLTENYKLDEGDIVWVPYSHITEFVRIAKHLLEPFDIFFDYVYRRDDILYIPNDYQDDQSGGGIYLRRR